MPAPDCLHWKASRVQVYSEQGELDGEIDISTPCQQFSEQHYQVTRLAAHGAVTAQLAGLTWHSIVC